jgi:F0F1-type ATP synthase assembly protein I
MSKLLLGVLVGAALGVLDGLTAWFTPVARPMLPMIVVGSTIKGILAGALIGAFSRKVASLPWALLVGLVVGLGLAYLVASQPLPDGKYYYFEIMLPGALVGLIVGYATQRYGARPVPRATAAPAPR